MTATFLDGSIDSGIISSEAAGMRSVGNDIFWYELGIVLAAAEVFSNISPP